MQTPPTLSVGHFWPTALTKGGVKAYAAVVKGAELLIIELFIYSNLSAIVPSTTKEVPTMQCRHGPFPTNLKTLYLASFSGIT
jgi:hypothetical protein